MTRAADPAQVLGAYPERLDAPEGTLDRFVSHLGWRLHQVLRRSDAEPEKFAATVRAHAARLPQGPLAPRVPEMRYRMRRDGLSRAVVAECLALCCAAVKRAGTVEPSTEAIGAARRLLSGSMVDHVEPAGRVTALSLAACALAVKGTPVHLLSASEARAQTLHATLREPLTALGLNAGLVVAKMPPREKAMTYRSAVVCATHREVAAAYLHDRLQMAGKPRLFLRALSADASRAGERDVRMLPGLCFALVDEADLVLLDDAYAPVTITREVDQGQEALLYEQALELARAFVEERDFGFDAAGVHITESGAERLTRLVAPLGGFWGARARREELVSTALAALHACERGVDYEVAGGRVVFPPPDPAAGPDEAEIDPVLVKLVELKEGCRTAGTRDVLARISVPRFLRRYVDLGGVCADARGIEGDLWALYGFKTTRVGPEPPRNACAPRVIRAAEGKRVAIAQTARARAAAGAVVVAVRSPGEARALVDALSRDGITAGLVRGVMDDAEQGVIADLDHAGTVAVALFPAASNVTREQRGGVPLHLIVAELHDARRHVTQLSRAFRADSCEIVLSLDEEGVASSLGGAAAAIIRVTDAACDELPAWQSRWIAAFAQRRSENARALMRRDIMMREEYLSTLLAFSGRAE